MATALRNPAAPRPARRTARENPSPSATAGHRRIFQLSLVFVTLVLLLNALVGDRGLMETLRARREHQELVTTIERLRAEKARLQEEARRLQSDPATIEALARQELGLVKPGELLFIIRDSRPAATSGR